MIVRDPFRLEGGMASSPARRPTAKLVTGGAEAPEGLEQGYFVLPTVFSEVTPEMTIAQEEIHSPRAASVVVERELKHVR